jgi:hypothetical protein
MMTNRASSHRNTSGLVPEGALYPAATHSGGGGAATLNLTSKWVPPAVRTRLSCPCFAFDGTTKVRGMLAAFPGGILTGEAFSHVAALAGLTEIVTSIGEVPAFFTASGVIV